jgi:hypothetical protein
MLKIAYCRANAMAVPDWMLESCQKKECNQIAYICEADLIDMYRKQGEL